MTLVSDIRKNNWILLSAMYPENIIPSETTFAWMVNAADQQTRLEVATWSFAAFLVLGLIPNQNSTNLHGVYRDQLAGTWLTDSSIQLQELDTCEKGGPLQLISGTLNRMGTRADPDPEQQSRFTFSSLYCGTNKIGFRPADTYEGNRTLGDAIAVSGAAVSPINSPGVLARVLLYLTNFRLGQWVVSPTELVADSYWPSPLITLFSHLRYPEQRKYLFVTNGGHLDNTGLAALLERRCQFMILADAGYDPEYRFSNITKVLHAARAKYGIHAEVANCNYMNTALQTPSSKNLTANSFLSPLRSGDDGFSKRHFVVIEITYPSCNNGGRKLSQRKGILIIAKSSLTGDEPVELSEMASSKTKFPHDPTTDQFLPPDRFEAYVELGRHIGEAIDVFVSSGELNGYKLPLDWQSTVAPTPDVNYATLAPEQREEVLAQILTDGTCDGRNVEFVLAYLNSSFEARPVESGPEDRAAFLEWQRNSEDVVDRVCHWVYDKRPKSLDDRKLFCEGLCQLVSNYVDSAAKSTRTHFAFYRMLEILGAGLEIAEVSKKELLSNVFPIAETIDTPA